MQAKRVALMGRFRMSQQLQDALNVAKPAGKFGNRQRGISL